MADDIKNQISMHRHIIRLYGSYNHTIMFSIVDNSGCSPLTRFHVRNPFLELFLLLSQDHTHGQGRAIKVRIVKLKKKASKALKENIHTLAT